MKSNSVLSETIYIPDSDASIVITCNFAGIFLDASSRSDCVKLDKEALDALIDALYRARETL